MTLTISANRLSYGAKGDDVARLQAALQALGRTIPASETSPPVMGAGTVAVVKALQQEFGMANPTGIVDSGTVESINSKLASLAIDGRVVRGSVRDANGNPVKGVTVSAFIQGPNGESATGSPATTMNDGSYTLSYTPPPGGRADLRLQVSTTIAGVAGNTIVVLDTSPSSASILTDAGPLEVVDFVLTAKAAPPKSEYEQILSDITPLLGSRVLTSLAEDATHHDVSVLAAQSGYSTDQIAALVKANQLAKDAAVPPQVIYAWLRQGLPWNVNALQAAHPDSRLKALQRSVSQGLVPATVGGKKIEDYLAGFAPISAAPLRGLLGGILPNAGDQIALVALYVKNSQDPAAFWKQVAADPTLGPHASDLKLAVQIAALTNKHEPLVQAVKALPGVKQASDLVRITKDQWKSLIQAPGVGVPPDTPGATADEKVTNYVGAIVSQVEAAFPTAYFAQQLPPSPVKTFLQTQTAYDLKSTYPAQFFKANPAAAATLNTQDQSQLIRYQRIYRLAGTASEALSLSGTVHSAQQIARMDRQTFATQFKDALSADRANAIYDQALRTNAIALALYAENSAVTNRTSLRVLPALDTGRQAAAAQDAIPDWQTLFGTFDFCACEECSSAHGPAAYLVDVLSFLSARPGATGKTVRDALFARRPDLGDIELSCENTNTPVPVIDLVNEILEDAVSPPVLFTPFPLVAPLEADLAQTNTTPALVAAFHPPLQSGATVEVIEAGKRWRIWDEAFAYSVTKDNSVLTVAARSRQTSGTAADRRTTPQYRNRAAYTELAQSVYPWTLPFDLPSEEAGVFLTHLGVPRRDLIEALRVNPASFDPASAVAESMAAEGLGLTDMERKIIVGETLSPPRQPEDFWGGATVASLTVVQELLNRSGLSYADLQALILTWFVNPRGALSITAQPGAPVDTCDTSKLEINGLAADVLSRIHCFVRLSRALGWTIPDSDRAVHSLLPDSPSPVMINELLVRLDHLRILMAKLGLTVAQALALWKPIDTVEPGSLYRSLFYNPAVFRPQDDAFRLRPDGQELADSTQLISAHIAPIRAAFRLDSQNLAVLTAKTDGKLNLANLSVLYRHVVLAKHLGIAIPDLLTALDLTGLNPFSAATSNEAVRLIDVVGAIQNSGFSVPQLNYLIRHQFNPPAPFVPLDSVLASTLSDLRADLRQLAATVAADQVERDAAASRVLAATGLPADITASLLDLATKGDAIARQRLVDVSAMAAIRPDLRADLLKLSGPSAAEAAVIDRISAALSLSGDMTEGLITRVKHGGEFAVRRFIELPAIEQATPVTRDSAKPQFETLEKLLKISAIIQTVGLPASQLDWLFRENAWLAVAPDPIAPPVALSGWYSLIQLTQLRQDLGLGDGAIEAILNALTTVAVASGQPAQSAAKQGFMDALNKWQGWTLDDLATFIGKPDNVGDLGILGAKIPDDYQLNLIVRLSRALRLTKRIGVTASQANQWCDVAVTDDEAKAVRGSAKSKYDDDAWRTIVAPLQNSLRDRQREALVAYLVARPAKWNPALANADANRLFDYFLVDVEMTSCQLTSRIKQAMGSVQLFAQRCLMGLEAGIDTSSDPKWAQWDWMKNFRVWEANRKIWMYPENWIVPELRDDKTPFFKDLENELMQSDLDNAAAEQVLMHYLEKLDAVSRLQIVGMYEDDDDKVLHVFGRTFHTPPIYYYRRRHGVTQSWTPWEKLDLDISGDHLIPVMWNRKLMLIWPIFTRKQTEKTIVMPGQNEPLASGDPYWEIQLAWSEFQYGRWSGKNLSEPAIFTTKVGDGDIFPEIPPGYLPGTIKTPEELGTVLSFKAFISGETLLVRAYLRWDSTINRGSLADKRIAHQLGEFTFFGCRKLVTVTPYADIPPAFVLAPSGTTFDRMRFTGEHGLTLFDGTFPTNLTDDPQPTLGNKHDIPVLDQTPTAFHLLAPHQDLQFVGNRPFFFEDGARAFLCHLNRHVLPGFDGTWVNGSLATAQRADYFPSPNPPSPGVAPSHAVNALTVLVPGPSGQRTAHQSPLVNLTPAFSPTTLLPTSVTLHRYTFANFHHPYICEFVKTLDSGGIPALMSYETQNQAQAQSFDTYAPKPIVVAPHPSDEVEFDTGGAYELYNWELFFHIPLLFATRLSQNQRFEDAQRWFHFIFNPAGRRAELTPQRYWAFKPFHDRSSSDYEAQSVKAIETMAASGPSPELKVAIEEWRENAFSPYAIGRLRTTAFQKTVVMKYLDNLIAWGDHLFRANTLETINEGSLLYVLAAEILGPRPAVIQRNIKPVVQTFNTLLPVGPLGNTLEQIEMLVPNSGGSASLGGPQGPDLPSDKILYFCVPENDVLLGYWDTVADRLFKIRHCLNIQGQVQQLPLFEPPIDPALLVRARAAGLSIGDVLADITAPLPNYRFSVMIQKANEVAAEVKNLGAELLSVLEKQDAEALSTLRSGQELRLLQAVRDVRAKQVDEASTNIAALQQSQSMAQARKDYYESRDFISPLEGTALGLMAVAQAIQILKGTTEAISIPLSLLPDAKAGSPTTIGITIGGSNIAESHKAHRNYLGTLIESMNLGATVTNRLAEYGRRQDEWDQQKNLATIELKQIDQQLAAAEIRLAIANQELSNHDQQIENAKDVDQFLRTKFTNQDLFQWMIARVSSLYFQSYQLAYDLAKRAELCMQHELGFKPGDTSIVQFGYWDSLKKGLLAGDRLLFDLKRLEVTYLDGNIREFEMTKNISLRQIDPVALLQLRAAGTCTFIVPEEALDIDCPGHYFRRIRSIALTLPCVAGPYSGINCTVTLISSTVRTKPVLLNNNYARQFPDDSRFTDYLGSVVSIVTSSGQADSGLFENNLRDERYLPFEQSGIAGSQWQLSLPSDVRQFDFDTITDAVLHVRYTSRDGSDALRAAATSNLKILRDNAQTVGSVCLFSVRHDFPSQWAKFQSVTIAAGTPTAQLLISFTPELYPFWSQGLVGTSVLKAVQFFAEMPPSDTTTTINIYSNADKSGKTDSLSKTPGGLLAGALTNIDRPAAITDATHPPLSVFFDNNTMNDLWLAITWGKS